MATNDILPVVDANGGSARVDSTPIGANTSADTANTSWRIGEVLVVTAASGDIDVIADGAEDPALGLHRIAAGSSEGLLHKIAGPSPATGDADGQISSNYTLAVGQEFVTRNVFDNSDTNIGPAGDGTMTSATIGATADLWRDNTAVSDGPNGTFGIDINGDYFTITRILDVKGDDTSVSGAMADKVYFARVQA